MPSSGCHVGRRQVFSIAHGEASRVPRQSIHCAVPLRPLLRGEDVIDLLLFSVSLLLFSFFFVVQLVPRWQEFLDVAW